MISIAVIPRSRRSSRRSMAASNVPASVKVPTCTSEITYSAIGVSDPCRSVHSKSSVDHLRVAVHAVGLSSATRDRAARASPIAIAVPSAGPEPGDERARGSRALAAQRRDGASVGPVTTTSTRARARRPDAELDTAVARPGAELSRWLGPEEQRAERRELERQRPVPLAQRHRHRLDAAEVPRRPNRRRRRHRC